MTIWNTSTIVKDLSSIIPITSIEVIEGGDSTSDTLIINMGGVVDKLFVKGFNPEYNPDKNLNDVDITHIELTDGLSSAGGLNSSDFRLARVYIDVRQYFINRGYINVVPAMGAYF